MKRTANRTVSIATLALGLRRAQQRVAPILGDKAHAQAAKPSPAAQASIDCESSEAVPGVTPQQYFEYW